MTKYIALLRGVNVGGNNKIAMPELKAAFERTGFIGVTTYINSGNVVFDSDGDEIAVKTACEMLIAANFNLAIAVGIIPASELSGALANAPDWWDNDPAFRHNAIFVIPPMTAYEICTQMGEAKPEYEKIASHGRVIFWSAPLAAFSHARWSGITRNKAAYNAMTIRNANTAKKLAALAEETTSQ